MQWQLHDAHALSTCPAGSQIMAFSGCVMNLLFLQEFVFGSWAGRKVSRAWTLTSILLQFFLSLLHVLQARFGEGPFSP